MLTEDQLKGLLSDLEADYISLDVNASRPLRTPLLNGALRI